MVVLVLAAGMALTLSRTAAAQDKQDVQRLKDKIDLLEAKMELLKKENELLKKENDLLRKELELAKKEGGKGTDPKDVAGKGLPKVTHNGILYQVASSKRNGDKWQLVLEATSQNVDKKITLSRVRAITDDGKAFEMKSGLQGIQLLPAGVKIRLELNMAGLPKTVQSITRLEVYESGFGKQVSFVFEGVPVE
jgi:hypothetical protein